MKISPPKRLEALNSEIKRLEGLIEHDTPILARLRSMEGDCSVSEVLDSAKIHFAENRIIGIRAELDHALNLQVAQATGSMPIISSWSIICFARRAGRLWGRS